MAGVRRLSSRAAHTWCSWPISPPFASWGICLPSNPGHDVSHILQKYSVGVYHGVEDACFEGSLEERADTVTFSVGGLLAVPPI